MTAVTQDPAASGRPAGVIVRCENLVPIYRRRGAAGHRAARGGSHGDRGRIGGAARPVGRGKYRLWLLAGLLRPTASQVEVCGAKIAELKPAEARNMRLRELGIVMQNPGRNLIPHETVAGNVLFAQTPTRRARSVDRQRAMALLDVGRARSARRTPCGEAVGRRAAAAGGGSRARQRAAAAVG